MRITLSLVLTLGVGFGLAQPAWAQTKQNAWQRLTGMFKSKKDDAKKNDANKEPKVEVRLAPTTPSLTTASPTTAREGRGVVFIEEPKTPTPQATGWASTGAKPPVISSAPVGQRVSVPVTPAPSQVAAPPMQFSQPKIVDSTSPVTPPKLVASPIRTTPAGQPKIVEAGAPVNRPAIVESAVPVNQQRIVAPPVTATPVNYPKAAAMPVIQPQPPAKHAKGMIAGRDVTRLTRQLSQACPKARNIKLTFTSPTEVTVEMDVTSVEECNRHAEQIFAIRDLDPYRVNLKFNVPQN